MFDSLFISFLVNTASVLIFFEHTSYERVLHLIYELKSVKPKLIKNMIGNSNEKYLLENRYLKAKKKELF